MATSNSRTSATAAKSPTQTSKKTETATKSVVKAVAKSTSAPKKTATKTGTKSATKVASKAVSKSTSKSVNKASSPSTDGAAPQNKKVTLRGRSVFLVQTTAAGVTVRTAWMSEDKKLMEMPAVFPDVNYAVNLIDDLKRQVLKHFSQAAQVGAQAIANQRAGEVAQK